MEVHIYTTTIETAVSLILPSHDPDEQFSFVLFVNGTGGSHISLDAMWTGLFVSCQKPQLSYKLRTTPEHWHLKRTAFALFDWQLSNEACAQKECLSV